MIPASKIKEISQLAHIHLEPEEATALERDLQKVFAWVETIEKLSVQYDDSGDKVPSHLRKDKIITENIPEEIMKNAPQAQGHLFTVPKVIKS